MTTSEEDHAVAAALAGEVEDTETGKAWRKVTTLLDRFGAFRLTPAVRNRVESALLNAGLEVKPPLSEVERWETVRLSLAERPGQGADGGRARSITHVAPLEEAVRPSEWLPGRRPRARGLFENAALAEGAVTLFEVDVLHVEPETVFDAIGPVCPELTREALDQLFRVDPLPRAQVYGDNHEQVFVSSFGVTAQEPKSGGDDADSSKAGALVFQIVDLLAGPGWLIACWHRSARYEEVDDIVEGPPEGREEARRAVEDAWCRSSLRGSADLGALVLHELARTYPGATRILNSWMEQWELDFHRRLDQTERRTLTAIRSLTGEFGHRLRALEQQAMGSGDSWFPGTSDPRWTGRTGQLIARSLSDLAALGTKLRDALELIAAHSASHQAQRGRRLEQKVAVVTSVLLVPTLVAGIFGANVRLPGGGRWEGFALMVVLMIVAAGALYVVIRPRE